MRENGRKHASSIKAIVKHIRTENVDITEKTYIFNLIFKGLVAMLMIGEKRQHVMLDKLKYNTMNLLRERTSLNIPFITTYINRLVSWKQLFPQIRFTCYQVNLGLKGDFSSFLANCINIHNLVRLKLCERERDWKKSVKKAFKLD